MHLFTCAMCDEVKKAPRRKTALYRIWFRYNAKRGKFLRYACCECLGLLNSHYLTIISVEDVADERKCDEHG